MAGKRKVNFKSSKEREPLARREKVTTCIYLDTSILYIVYQPTPFEETCKTQELSTRARGPLGINLAPVTIDESNFHRQRWSNIEKKKKNQLAEILGAIAVIVIILVATCIGGQDRPSLANPVQVQRTFQPSLACQSTKIQLIDLIN